MLADRDYTRRPPWSPRAESSMTSVLIWTTVAVFFLQWLTRDQIVVWLALSPADIQRWQLWRLGTYLFAHGGFFHLFMNMWALYLFGRPLESALGGHRFLNLYFTSGIIGGLVWLFFNWQSPLSAVEGASGAVFGVMMAAAMKFPNERIMLLIPPVVMRLKTFVIVYAGLELFFELSRLDGNVAHLAHLGGMLGAFLFMRDLYTPAALRRLGGDLRSAWSNWRAGHRRRRLTLDDAPDGNRPPDPAAAARFSAEVDRVLDKIGRDGIQSLSAEERRILEKARERLRTR
ncbi:MAG: rhomboid family intramembrane serine protease [Lentisphaeria bacterium]